jgi:hypothetical protein
MDRNQKEDMTKTSSSANVRNKKKSVSVASVITTMKANIIYK